MKTDLQINRHNTNIANLIEEYEDLADRSEAQTAEAKNLFEEIKKYMKENCLELCSHNHACFGSKRYEKYYNKTLKRPISIKEWDLLTREEKDNFENLKEFPFKI